MFAENRHTYSDFSKTFAFPNMDYIKIPSALDALVDRLIEIALESLLEVLKRFELQFLLWSRKVNP